MIINTKQDSNMKKTMLYPTLFAVALSVIGGYIFYVSYIQKTVVTGHVLLPEMNKMELVKKTDVIAVGTVVKSESKYVQRAEGNLPNVITEVTLEIEKVLKNNSVDPLKTIVVEVLGGSISKTSVVIEGVATFQVGERVLVFLEKSESGNFTVYGWMNGKYSLDREDIKDSDSERFKSIFGKVTKINQISDEIKKLDLLDHSDTPVNSSEKEVLPNKDANSEANMFIQKSQ